MLSKEKSPYYHHFKSLYGLIEFKEKYLNDLSQQNDKTLVWIVGFSIGALGLLLANIEKLFNVHFVIVFLLISIISGVLGRIVNLVSYQLIIPVWERLFSINIIKENPFSKRELKGNESAEVLKLFILTDFNLTEEYLMAIFTNFDNKEKLTQIYNELSEWVSAENNRAAEDFKNNYMKIQNITKEEEYQNKTVQKKLYPQLSLFLSNLSSLLYFVSYGSFVVAAILFGCYYLSS